MDRLLTAIKAAAEPTRLRLLALCGHAELSVTELTQILGQSQPRVSRHLKLLCDAGLLDRSREGTWAFFRLADEGPMADLARTLIDAIPGEDAVLTLDLERLDAVKRQRDETAARYFREKAARWHEIRSLHVPEREVEEALLDLLPPRVADLLDIGTGTGRMLELMAPRVAHALGIDASREMLAIARNNLDKAGHAHCRVRQADMYQLPLAAESFDAIVIHQVLHYAESPGAVLAEAARVLRPGGTLLIVDLDLHDHEALRSEHNHRRLGIDPADMSRWLDRAGLVCLEERPLAGAPLTVIVWHIAKPARAAATPGTADLPGGERDNG
ncbi:MAG: metalloregulator ArsR/SmtB family transcription factor [Alphaproteobacteria bacterium]